MTIGPKFSDIFERELKENNERTSSKSTFVKLLLSRSPGKVSTTDDIVCIHNPLKLNLPLMKYIFPDFRDSYLGM